MNRTLPTASRFYRDLAAGSKKKFRRFIFSFLLKFFRNFGWAEEKKITVITICCHPGPRKKPSAVTRALTAIVERIPSPTARPASVSVAVEAAPAQNASAADDRSTVVPRQPYRNDVLTPDTCFTISPKDDVAARLRTIPSRQCRVSRTKNDFFTIVMRSWTTSFYSQFFRSISILPYLSFPSGTKKSGVRARIFTDLKFFKTFSVFSIDGHNQPGCRCSAGKTRRKRQKRTRKKRSPSKTSTTWKTCSAREYLPFTFTRHDSCQKKKKSRFKKNQTVRTGHAGAT